MTNPRNDRRTKRRAEAADRQAARDARSDAEQVQVLLARGVAPSSPEVARLTLRDWPAGMSVKAARNGDETRP